MEEVEMHFDWGKLRALYHIVSTSRPPVILWPGLGMTAEEFLPLFDIGNHTSIVAIDPPGHGQSSTIKKWDEHMVAAVFRRILKDLSTATVIVGGHSVGAVVALSTLEILPWQVSGIILIDGGYFNPFSTRSIKDLKDANRRFLDENVFPSWDHYFESEKAQSKIWNKNLLLASQAAAIQTHDGTVKLRIELDTLNQVTEFVKTSSLDNMAPHSVPALLLFGKRLVALHGEGRTEVSKLKEVLPTITMQQVNGEHDLLRDCPDELVTNIKDFLVKNFPRDRQHQKSQPNL